jgi:hypothetical protein
MEIKFSRELKSPREEVATIVMTWNPSLQTEDNAAAIVAAVTDMAEQYIRMLSILNIDNTYAQDNLTQPTQNTPTVNK